MVMNKNVGYYMALALSTLPIYARDYRPVQENIDIAKERELILQKKSKLSANKRKWDLRQYEKLNFKDS